MGRGRAKAKQTKVARDLKYQTFETDFGALAKELHGDEAEATRRTTVPTSTSGPTTPSPGATDFFAGRGRRRSACHETR